MNVVGTLLNLASLGAEISMASKVAAMREQGEAAIVMQGIINEIRNQIFKYNQAAKEILAVSVEPKVAACAMRILELRLNESGLTPDIFPELNDKEYVSSTTRLIRENAIQLMMPLSVEEKKAAEAVSFMALALPNYTYYVDNYTMYQQYQQALPASKGTPGFTRFVGILSLIVGGVVTLMYLCVTSALGLPEFSQIFLPVLIVGAGLLIGGAFKVKNTGKGIEAKKTVERISELMNIERFIALDKKFDGNIEQITNLKHEAQTAVSNFFGNSKLLTA